ncbi:hypothetical protein TIFTF001_016371 [Ficus carica]|uniref:Uncharacterized protein n=1 Tax=Ficus carica TaxID=3494 RepID=A0AA88AAG1_FICCA|nr:hypothetical protein TIFTF001_016371 [Ficus carica]
MKGILVNETATYVGLIELVRSAISIRGPAKTIVMRYGVEPELPLVRIQCDADVKFYIYLKKKDAHMLSKLPITIDVLDESAAEAMPPELGESNHIDVQLSREGVQSDEAMQHVDDRNLIIPPPPPHIPHISPHVDELKFAGDARQSNDNSIAASIRAHNIVNNTTSQSVYVPSSDSVSGSVVVADYTPVTMRINCSELFVVKRYDDVHTCLIEIVQGHHRQAKSWMIGECVKSMAREGSSTNQLEGDDAESYNAASKHGWPYCRPVIVVDGSALKAKFGGMLLALRDSIGTRESLAIVADRHKGIEFVANLVASRSYLLSEYHRHIESIRNHNPDMHRYLLQVDTTKWSREYFNGQRYAIMTTNIAESLNSVDRKVRREEALKLTSKLAPKAEKLIRTNFSIGLIVTPRPADQFEYAVTNNASQIWIVNMSESTFHPIGSADGWDVLEKVRS